MCWAREGWECGGREYIRRPTIRTVCGSSSCCVGAGELIAFRRARRARHGRGLQSPRLPRTTTRPGPARTAPTPRSPFFPSPSSTFPRSDHRPLSLRLHHPRPHLRSLCYLHHSFGLAHRHRLVKGNPRANLGSPDELTCQGAATRDGFGRDLWDCVQEGRRSSVREQRQGHGTRLGSGDVSRGEAQDGERYGRVRSSSLLPLLPVTDRLAAHLVKSSSTFSSPTCPSTSPPNGLIRNSASPLPPLPPLVSPSPSRTPPTLLAAPRPQSRTTSASAPGSKSSEICLS